MSWFYKGFLLIHKSMTPKKRSGLEWFKDFRLVGIGWHWYQFKLNDWPDLHYHGIKSWILDMPWFAMAFAYGNHRVVEGIHGWNVSRFIDFDQTPELSWRFPSTPTSPGRRSSSEAPPDAMVMHGCMVIRHIEVHGTNRTASSGHTLSANTVASTLIMMMMMMMMMVMMMMMMVMMIIIIMITTRQNGGIIQQHLKGPNAPPPGGKHIIYEFMMKIDEWILGTFKASPCPITHTQITRIASPCTVRRSSWEGHGPYPLPGPKRVEWPQMNLARVGWWI